MKKYFLCGLVWVAGACVERPEPPPGTLSQSQMVQILTDIHLAEAKTSRANLRSLDSSRTLYQRYEQEIMKKHRIDTAAYQGSLRFYLENTGYLDEIYQAVVDTLSQREKQGRLGRPEKPPKVDTLGQRGRLPKVDTLNQRGRREKSPEMDTLSQRERRRRLEWKRSPDKDRPRPGLPAGVR